MSSLIIRPEKEPPVIIGSLQKASSGYGCRQGPYIAKNEFLLLSSFFCFDCWHKYFKVFFPCIHRKLILDNIIFFALNIGINICRYYITYHMWNSKPEFINATHKVLTIRIKIQSIRNKEKILNISKSIKN